MNSPLTLTSITNERGNTVMVKSEFLKQIKGKSVHYLENSSVNLYGFKFYGSPHQPEYCHWAFSKPRDLMYKCWEKIPSDTDILITHGPAYGSRDSAGDKKHRGCEALTFELKRIKPYLHLFGHIHTGYGHVDKDKTLFINASSCNENLKPVNKPVVVGFS